MTAEEADRDRKIREQIEQELPDLIARHHNRTANHMANECPYCLGTGNNPATGETCHKCNGTGLDWSEFGGES